MTPHFRSALLDGVEGLRHGFFGREGGVSSGIYASLNAGPGSRDDPEDVAENRARIAGAMRVGPDFLLSLHQVHSSTVVRADGPWQGPRPEGDALVTATRGLALTVLTADCAPVLLVDPEAEVIGAAHAGWKGAAGGVIEACVTAMASIGAEAARIVAAVGPTIQQASYEVGPDLQVAVCAADAAAAPCFAPGAGDKLQFDLPRYCALRLARAGVKSVDVLPHDTYALSDALHSHRRHVHLGIDDYGRNCAAIMLA